MTVSYQTNIQDQGYNGWTNYETWNVALWIGNDESIYNAARKCNSYQELCEVLYDCGSKETPDGVSFTSPKLNHVELNELLQDL